MASLSPRTLLTLGLFVFGMDTAAYQSLQRTREWRHATAERIGARSVGQYIGPGADTVTLGGLIVPEVAGSYSSLETLAEMAETGEAFPLTDGLGNIKGQFRIVRLDEDHRTIMAGGIPRQVDFVVDLERADDVSDQQGLTV